MSDDTELLSCGMRRRINALPAELLGTDDDLPSKLDKVLDMSWPWIKGRIEARSMAPQRRKGEG